MNNVKNEILRLTDDGRLVFAHYLGVAIRPKKKFRNPFYEDTKPSCNIFYDIKSHQYVFKDHGDASYYGDCFWFVGLCKNLKCETGFSQILQEIIQDMSLNIYNNVYAPGTISTGTHPKPLQTAVIRNEPEPDSPKKYMLKEKPFSNAELAYWHNYGITEKTLSKYGVVTLDEFEIEGEEKPFIFKSTPKSPIFAYKRERFSKIYRPKEKNRFLFVGEKPSQYIFGMAQLPSCGDMVFITGGEKDVLSLAAHGFNAICFNSETANIPENTIEMLYTRFKHIFVMYDTDETGRNAMQKAVDEFTKYDVQSIILPLAGTKTEKDISDFFTLSKTSDDLRNLINAKLESMYPQTILLMKSFEMDYNNPPESSKVVISSGQTPIGTHDNLLCITGGEGTGKSNFVSTLISGALFSDEHRPDIDTLGMTITPNIMNHAVLQFDTEQSEPQLYKNMEMTLRRSGLSQFPTFFHSFCLVALSRQDRLKLIQDSMDLYYHRHGGIHLVVIDGVADLVRSANDEAESTAVIEELYRLAGIYHTCIVLVLHFVPMGIKLRGHIGSELQRKAASIISIEKDDNPRYSVIKAIKVRDGNPLDMPMTLMVWSKEKKMFVNAGEKSQDEQKRHKHDRLTSLADKIFGEKSAMNYSDLTSAIIDGFGCSERTAKDYISYMVKEKIVEKVGVNQYIAGKDKIESYKGVL